MNCINSNEAAAAGTNCNSCIANPAMSSKSCNEDAAAEAH